MSMHLSNEPPSKEEKKQLVKELIAQAVRDLERERDQPGCTSLTFSAPTEEHRAELYKSGLTDDTIWAAKQFTVSKFCTRFNATINQLLGRDDKSGIFSGHGQPLVFPYFDRRGNGVYLKAKFPHPRKTRDGGIIKYEAYRGLKNDRTCYFPCDTYSLLDSEPPFIVFTEGEKKSLALRQMGVCAIGLNGVWGGQEPGSKGKRLQRHIKEEVLRLPEYCRTFLIMFDSDAEGNDDVQFAEKRLSKLLCDAGCNVQIVRLDPGPNGEKRGADDWYATEGGEEYLLRKIGDALAKPMKLRHVKTRDSKDLGAEYLATAKQSLLHGHADKFWLESSDPENRGYRAISDENLGIDVRTFLDSRYSGVKRTTKLDVVDALKSMPSIQMPKNLKPPFPIGEIPKKFRDFDCAELAFCQNGVLHVPSKEFYEYETGMRLPWFFTTPLGAKWNPDVGHGKIAECADTWFVDNELAKLLLQEISGYMLTADNRFEKAFCPWGKSGSGKGTYIETLTAVLGGPGAVYEGDFLSIGSRFGRAPLVGKLAMTVSELDLPERSDRLKPAIEIFKRITGNGAIPVEEKGVDGYSCKVPVRFIFTPNELPEFPDAAGALKRRLILLRFRHAVTKVDINLKKELLTPDNLSGFLNYAVDGYQRLLDQGKFTQLAKADDEESDADVAVGAGSPWARFARECCDTGDRKRVSWDAFYKVYSLCWCPKYGETAVKYDTFRRKMLSVTELNIDSNRMPRGKRGPGVLGVTLKKEWRLSGLVTAEDDIVDDEPSSREPPKTIEPKGTEGLAAKLATRNGATHAPSHIGPQY